MAHLHERGSVWRCTDCLGYSELPERRAEPGTPTWFPCFVPSPLARRDTGFANETTF
jgi:hypothetical protein